MRLAQLPTAAGITTSNLFWPMSWVNSSDAGSTPSACAAGSVARARKRKQGELCFCESISPNAGDRRLPQTNSAVVCRHGVVDEQPQVRRGSRAGQRSNQAEVHFEKRRRKARRCRSVASPCVGQFVRRQPLPPPHETPKQFSQMLRPAIRSARMARIKGRWSRLGNGYGGCSADCPARCSSQTAACPSYVASPKKPTSAATASNIRPIDVERKHRTPFSINFVASQNRFGIGIGSRVMSGLSERSIMNAAAACTGNRAAASPPGMITGRSQAARSKPLRTLPTKNSPPQIVPSSP